MNEMFLMHGEGITESIADDLREQVKKENL